ncbi:MAG: acyl-CoA dehydrogenase family protein [Acidimicrobiales bacterium]
MRLAWGPGVESFRTELAAFLDEHAPPEAVGRGSDPELVVGGIPEWAHQWQATLFDHGWLVPAFPPELGGRCADAVQSLVYFEEMARRGLPRSLHFPGYGIVAPSLLEFGSEEQKRLVPAALRGDSVWCIGMSEPGAGSDLGALSTRATLDGDHFVVDGQKVWTSYAMWAERCFCYVRTDTTAPKYGGISVLIIDLTSPGVEIRPLRQITGSVDFAEVFFTGVAVPRNNLVGDLNDGWRVTMGSLAHERGGLWLEWVAGLDHLLKRLVALVELRKLTTDPTVRRRLAAAYAEIAELRALGYKGFASFARDSSTPEHSLLKLAASELRRDLCEMGLELAGPAAAVTDPGWTRDSGDWMLWFMGSFAGTIGGGTSEIQRNVIAQRILGLPHSQRS